MFTALLTNCSIFILSASVLLVYVSLELCYSMCNNSNINFVCVRARACVCKFVYLRKEVHCMLRILLIDLFINLLYIILIILDNRWVQLPEYIDFPFFDFSRTCWPVSARVKQKNPFVLTTCRIRSEIKNY